jgi:hypothetical protein
MSENYMFEDIIEHYYEGAEVIGMRDHTISKELLQDA